MHAELSGTVDFREKDDPSCLETPALARRTTARLHPTRTQNPKPETSRQQTEIYNLISLDGRREYDVRELLACIVDAGSLDEYKADYGKSLVCAYGRIGGRAIGIVANQRIRVQSKKIRPADSRA